MSMAPQAAAGSAQSLTWEPSGPTAAPPLDDLPDPPPEGLSHRDRLLLEARRRYAEMQASEAEGPAAPEPTRTWLQDAMEQEAPQIAPPQGTGPTWLQDAMEQEAPQIALPQGTGPAWPQVVKVKVNAESEGGGAAGGRRSKAKARMRVRMGRFGGREEARRRLRRKVRARMGK